MGIYGGRWGCGGIVGGVVGFREKGILESIVMRAIDWFRIGFVE